MKNQKDNKLCAVILAGGVGSRFWPLSRQLAPKQFLKVVSDKTLLEQTISRINKLVPSEDIYVITNQHYIFEIKKELMQFGIPDKNIFLEPIGKNTAPAIALAARYISLKNPNAKMAILPADHIIFKSGLFIKAIEDACDLAQEGRLVTLGIVPNRAATGYGYIKTLKKISAKSKGYIVDRFIEKPSIEKAKNLVGQNNYFWNSGIFIWKVSAILEEIKRYLPSLSNKINSIYPNKDINKIWQQITPISIDYAVLEKSKKVAMIPAKFDWSDIGSWQSLKDILQKDRADNVLKADAFDLDSRNILVWSKDRFVATLGLKDLIIVDTPDALLVCRDDYSEKVKGVVDFLKNKKREEYLYHKKVNRPWGSFTVMQTDEDFSARGRPAFGWKVKLVEIDPGKRLSLQFHRKRAEHWVVVEGIAKVTCGKAVKLVRSNESIYIPARKIHRLENPSRNKALKIIEVQTGNYLREDDIVRIKDDYKRK